MGALLPFVLQETNQVRNQGARRYPCDTAAAVFVLVGSAWKHLLIEVLSPFGLSHGLCTLTSVGVNAKPSQGLFLPYLVDIPKRNC